VVLLSAFEYLGQFASPLHLLLASVQERLTQDPAALPLLSVEFLLQTPIHQHMLDAWLPRVQGAEERAQGDSVRDGEEEVVSSRVQQVRGEEARVARDRGGRMRLQRRLILHNYLALNLFKIR